METGTMPIFEGRAVYENVNREIVALYKGDLLVLDIGCGSGALGAHIKALNPHCTVHGIDISPPACDQASKRLDQVWRLDLDHDPLPEDLGHYDLIILGDLLEHLRRPDQLLSSLHHHLTGNGRIILSVPNIANYSIRLRLMRGEFHYTETGILDRTHVRFFTLKTISDMIRSCGFTVTGQRYISRFPAPICRFAPGLLAAQFIFEAHRMQSVPSQPLAETERKDILNAQ